MAQEKKLTGFTIKQQPLNEADLLLTFFSHEDGKQRLLLKSAKRVTSKLQGSLQSFILSRVSLVGRGSLATVVAAQPVKQYPELISNQHKMHAIIAVHEFLNRALPDAEPNNQLYELVKNLYEYLQECQADESTDLQSSLTQFYSKALQALGLEPELITTQDMPEEVYFNLSEGGFSAQSRSTTDVRIDRKDYQAYRELFLRPLGQFPSNPLLFRLITDFVGYQLERKLKSVSYFM